ncbi:MAG TPA: protein phosphatase 2C domain-containing protein [Gemmatimonadaceae bacterium]|nr:protein phosphatase 2C domain-containing protein [Gemmatimonadaceae bacterium]
MPTTERKPRDDELDTFGVSHKGKVRQENQDHFLLASLHKHLQVIQTSLTDAERLPLADERVAYIAMVADGVGGGVGGERASATTVEVATEYVVSSTNCYYRTADTAEGEFIETLEQAAMRCHSAVRARAKREGGKGAMATTLTLFMGVWPWYYLLQVGDSRYYLYRDGQLTQVTRDQTIAQELVDKGVMTRTTAQHTNFNNILSSAIGAEEALPVVTRLRADWGNVHLLCTDGLTKHVSDERIAECLGAMTSSRQACEQLLAEALEAGGTDNITIIVGRSVPRDVTP